MIFTFFPKKNYEKMGWKYGITSETTITGISSETTIPGISSETTIPGIFWSWNRTPEPEPELVAGARTGAGA